MKKRIIGISFFLLLAALFIFLEWQVSREIKTIEEPKAHIATGK